jgi:hypothetical protein
VRCVFIVKHASFSDQPIIVYPDVFTSGSDRLRTHQAVLICAVHEAWTGQAVPSTTMIPWAGLMSLDIGLELGALGKMQRLCAVSQIAAGILSQNASMVLGGLKAHPPLLSDRSGVTTEEIQAVLDLFPKSQAVPGREPRFLRELTKTINSVISTAAGAGPEKAVDFLTKILEEQKRKLTPVEEALRVARDGAQRRAFLKRFFSQMLDYSADRADAIFEMIGLFPELELKQMKADGTPERDPIRYQAALATILGMRQHLDEEISKDKQANSSKVAKELLANRIDGTGKFVLILRAFSLDVAICDVSPVDAVHGCRLFKIRPREVHIVDTICSILPKEIDVLTIANVLDPYPPSRPAKLFVTDIEWQTLAFSVIAEAAAIILIVPSKAEAKGSLGGVAQEIEAIRELGRVASTVVALVSSKALMMDEDEITDEITVDDIRELGFQSVFTDMDISERPSLLADRVRSSLA